MQRGLCNLKYNATAHDDDASGDDETNPGAKEPKSILPLNLAQCWSAAFFTFRNHVGN